MALAEFARNPIATVGLEEFTKTLEIANPLLAGIAPSQAYCNYWTLAFRNLASLEPENIGIGTLARAGFILAPTGPNNEGYPASAPANGPSEEREAQHEAEGRRHAQQPPAREHVPEHRRPGPAAGVRSGQRELHPGPDR